MFFFRFELICLNSEIEHFLSLSIIICRIDDESIDPIYRTQCIEIIVISIRIRWLICFIISDWRPETEKMELYHKTTNILFKMYVTPGSDREPLKQLHSLIQSMNEDVIAAEIPLCKFVIYFLDLFIF